MKNWGRCNTCYQEILLAQAESDAYQAEVNRRLKAAGEFYGAEFDKPKFGDQVKIALPHWPCGHYFVAIKQLVKLPNGRYTYQDAT